MKRDLSLAQMALFEPESADALDLLQRHAREFERASDAADLFEACFLPGARDEALRQAQRSYDSWLVCALFLDFEREAA